MERIVITDCDFGDGTVERAVLQGYEVELGAVSEAAEVADLGRGAVGLFVQWARVDESVFEALPELRAIVRYGIGLDNIDLGAAARHGVKVSNIDDYCLDEVAEHACALISAESRRIVEYDRGVKAGTWSLTNAPPPRLPEDDVVGIAGFGRIGRGVARRVHSLGHPVLYWDPLLGDANVQVDGERVASLHELAERSHHLSLHVPLTDRTAGIVDAEVLGLLGADGHLVNTGRGGLIQEDALLAALDNGTLGRASLDVLASEPPKPGTTSWKLAVHHRSVVTPHVAYLSTRSLARLLERAALRMKELVA